MTTFNLSSLRTGTIDIVEAKHGRFATFAGDKGIAGLLRYYGEYAENEISLLHDLILPGDSVIEIGTNIGTHAVPLSRRVSPAGTYIAYEPQPLVAALLQFNLALNAIGWVDVRVKAIGSATGSIVLPTVDYATHTNCGAVSLVNGQGTASVEINTLDNDCANIAPKLLKIDVENMELEVFRGASKIIAQHAPYVYFENNLHPREISLETLRYFENLPYDLYWDMVPLHDLNNFKHRETPYFDDIGYGSNVLAVPHARRGEFELVRSRHPLSIITDPQNHPLISIYGLG